MVGRWSTLSELLRWSQETRCTLMRSAQGHDVVNEAARGRLRAAIEGGAFFSRVASATAAEALLLGQEPGTKKKKTKICERG